MYFCRPKTTTNLVITVLLSSVATWLWVATLLSLLGMLWNGSLPLSSLLWCIHLLLLLSVVPVTMAITAVIRVDTIIAVTLAPIGAIEVKIKVYLVGTLEFSWVHSVIGLS